uniref:Uncharacterized protein n=1 Tax=Prorocentrum micans TaxID=2945 RepID=A0A7S2TEL3_PROMC
MAGFVSQKGSGSLSKGNNGFFFFFFFFKSYNLSQWFVDQSHGCANAPSALKAMQPHRGLHHPSPIGGTHDVMRISPLHPGKSVDPFLSQNGYGCCQRYVT